MRSSPSRRVSAFITISPRPHRRGRQQTPVLVLVCSPGHGALFLDPEHETGSSTLWWRWISFRPCWFASQPISISFIFPRQNPGALAHGLGAVLCRLRICGERSYCAPTVSRSRDVRVLFGRMGIFLAFSGCVDGLYYYGPGRGVKTGAWFDLLWSALLVIPMLIAVTWKQAEAPEHSLRSTAAREENLHRDFFSAVPAAGSVHVVAHRARAAGPGRGGRAAVVRVFERALAGHAEPAAAGQRSAAPRSLPRWPDQPVEP